MDVLLELKTKFREKVKNPLQKSPSRIYVDVDKENIPSFAEYLFKDLKARFITASGIHTPNGFEILYHFDFDQLNKVLTLKTYLDKNKPEIETISHIIIGANWIEREMWELLGINFKNHPNLKRLLLDDDWPQGDYPLRQKEQK